MIQFRWYQSEAIEAIFGYFAEFIDKNPIVVAPTGAGKSLMIAGFIAQALRMHPGTRIMNLTHVKKLIDQNAKKLQELWPTAPIGIFSAGLNKRDTMMPITFGGVASVAGKEDQFPVPDLLLIDECHLLSPESDTMYQRIIAEFRKRNPKLKVIGFTATHYRLGQGLLTDGDIFHDVCYDLSGIEAWNRLVREGHLVPPMNQKTATTFDVSQIKMTAGEYQDKDMQQAFNTADLNEKVCAEMIARSQDRHCWLIFCAGIEHAENICDIMNRMGIKSTVMHSKLPSKENDKRYAAWEKGEYRCMVNKDMLTTGVDNPRIDMIGMLRATASTSKWVQMLGRGTRPFSTEWFKKLNCLVLDFAGNTRRLGPINDPKLPTKKGKGGGDAPVRICPQCGSYQPASVRICGICGHEFEFALKLVGKASSDEVFRTDTPEVVRFYVSHATYSAYERCPGATPTMRVSYHTANMLQRPIDEWICFEHAGPPRNKARVWWSERFPEIAEAPATVREALTYTSQLRVPIQIDVIVNRQYPEIIQYVYD